MACAGLLLSSCGQGSSPAASATVITQASLATVDSGAFCIPDLNTTHLSLVPLQPGGASGDVPSDANAQQVREGAVPAPPNGRLLSRGRIVPQLINGAIGSPSLAGQTTMDVYETNCSPGDVEAFYVAALLQNQWAGGFVPASGAAPLAVSPDGARAGAVASGSRTQTLYDLAALTTARFVNSHPKGGAVVFISVLATIEAAGNQQERHPTYVQLIVQPSESTTGTSLLPPTVATTPNVGASAAPPGGESRP